MEPAITFEAFCSIFNGRFTNNRWIGMPMMTMPDTMTSKSLFSLLDDGVPIAYAASEDKVSPLLLLESDPIIAMAPQLMIRILMPSGKILQYRIMSLKDNVPWQNMISRNGTSLNKWGRWAI